MLDNWSRKDGSLYTQIPRTGPVSQASFSIPQSSKAMHVEDVTSITASGLLEGTQDTPPSLVLLLRAGLAMGHTDAL